MMRPRQGSTKLSTIRLVMTSSTSSAVQFAPWWPRTSIYRPVIMRIRDPKTTALIFTLGKMPVVVTCAKTEDDLRLASRKYAQAWFCKSNFLNLRIRISWGVVMSSLPIVWRDLHTVTGSLAAANMRLVVEIFVPYYYWHFLFSGLIYLQDDQAQGRAAYFRIWKD